MLVLVVLVVVILVAVSFAPGKNLGRIGGAIAAAELVFPAVHDGGADIGGAASEGVGVVLLEVEHEVVYCFAGKFSPLEHQVNVVDEFAVCNALFQHVQHNPQDIA